MTAEHSFSPQVSYYSALLAKEFQEDNPDSFTDLHDIISKLVSKQDLEIIEDQSRKFTSLPKFVLKSKIKWLENNSDITPLETRETQTKLILKDLESTSALEPAKDKGSVENSNLSKEVNNSLDQIDRNIKVFHKHNDGLKKFLKMEPDIQDTNNNLKKDKTIDLGIPLQTFNTTRRTNEEIFASKYPELKPRANEIKSYPSDTVINIGTDDECAGGEKLPSTSAFSPSQSPNSLVQPRLSDGTLFQGSEWQKINSAEEGSNAEGDDAEGDASSTDKKKKKKKKRKTKAEVNETVENVMMTPENADGDKTEAGTKSSRGARRSKLKAVLKTKETHETITTQDKELPTSEPIQQVATEPKKKKRTIKEYKRMKEEEKRKERETFGFTKVIGGQSLLSEANSERTPLLGPKTSTKEKSYNTNKVEQSNASESNNSAGSKNSKKEKKKDSKKKVSKKSSGSNKNVKNEGKNKMFDEFEKLASEEMETGDVDLTINFPLNDDAKKVVPEKHKPTETVDEVGMASRRRNILQSKTQRKGTSPMSNDEVAGPSSGAAGKSVIKSPHKMDPWPSLNTGFKGGSTMTGGKGGSGELTSYASKVKTNLDSAGCSIASSSEDSSSSSSSSSKSNEENLNEAAVMQNFTIPVTKPEDIKEAEVVASSDGEFVVKELSANMDNNSAISLPTNTTEPNTVPLDHTLNSNNEIKVDNIVPIQENVDICSNTATVPPSNHNEEDTDIVEIPGTLKDLFKNDWGLEFFDVCPTKDFTEEIDQNELLSHSDTLFEGTVYGRENQSIIIGTVGMEDNPTIDINNMQDVNDCDPAILSSKLNITSEEKDNTNSEYQQQPSISSVPNVPTTVVDSNDLYSDLERQQDAMQFNYQSSIKFLMQEWSSIKNSATVYQDDEE